MSHCYTLADNRYKPKVSLLMSFVGPLSLSSGSPFQLTSLCPLRCSLFGQRAAVTAAPLVRIPERRQT